MKKPSRLDEFRRETAAARHRSPSQAASPGPAKPGDIYLFPGDGDLATRWAILTIDANRPELLFAVPADGHPLFGLADAPVADETGHRLTLRCGMGLWVPRDAFRGDRFLCTLSDDQLRRSRAKARQVVAGAADGPEAAREAEADPEYGEWMSMVAAAVDRISSAIRTRAVVVTPAEFKPTHPFGGRAAESTPVALAAASPGMAEEVDLSEPTQSPPHAYRIGLIHPGETWLVRESAGVATLFRGEPGTAPPPAFGGQASGEWLPLAWTNTPGGTGARAFAPWEAGGVRLRFGDGEFALEVTVTPP